MKAASLKNWYSRREKALSPGPPLRLTRAVRKDPIERLRILEKPIRWLESQKHKQVDIKCRRILERLGNYQTRIRQPSTNTNTITTTTFTSTCQWVTITTTTPITNGPTTIYAPDEGYTITIDPAFSVNQPTGYIRCNKPANAT